MLGKILLILSLASITVFATQSSRVNTLGGFESSYTLGNDALAPMARSSIYDSSDVMLFPHLTNQHADLLSVFYAGPNSFSGFATFNIMPALSIGVADFKNSRQMWGLEKAGVVLDEDGNPIIFPISSNHTYSIFAAYNLGAMNFGLSLNKWSSSDKQEGKVFSNIGTADEGYITNSKTVDSSILGLKLSFGMDLGNNMGFDSLFNIDFGSYTNETYNSEGTPKTQLVNSADAYSSITLGGRFFMDITDAVKLTSWLFIDLNSESYKDLEYNDEDKKVNTVKYERSSSIINLGSAFEIETVKNKLIVSPSLGILLLSGENKTNHLTLPTKGSEENTEFSTLALPYFGVSVEYNIRKWLTIYSGYNKIIVSQEAKNYSLGMNTDQKVSETTGTLNSDNVTSNFAMGISLQNDTMKFTASLNKALLLTGPDFVSGSGVPMFLNATFQWNFGTPKQNITAKTNPSTMNEENTVKKETEVEKVIEENENEETENEETEETL